MAKLGDSSERTARCACGGLTAMVRGEPAAVYACSCLACQRRSGGAFAYRALFPQAAVTIAGARTLWRHHGDSGRWIEAAFCPTCGGTVFTRTEAWPSMIGISAGCFGDPDFPAPATLYWASRRHHWLAVPDGVELMETQQD